MAFDVTGATNSIVPVNRQDTPATQPVPPATTSRGAQTTAEPDVQVDTSLGRREAASRALVDEASDLGARLQENEALVDRLRTERERVATGADRNLNEQDAAALAQERASVEEDALEALQRIRANALEDPFGTGNFDAGTLAEDGFFVRNPGETIENLDGAVSALERQSELVGDRLEEVREAFNQGQDAELSDGNEPIVDNQEAVETAAQASEQIREETPFDVNGLSAQDRSTVLGALQT